MRKLEYTFKADTLFKMLFVQYPDFFELPKLPAEVSGNDMLLLWLSLFKAETEEELEKIIDSDQLFTVRIGYDIYIPVFNHCFCSPFSFLLICKH